MEVFLYLFASHIRFVVVCLLLGALNELHNAMQNTGRHFDSDPVMSGHVAMGDCLLSFIEQSILI